MPEGFPLIDAAGPGRRVYQVTVARKRTKTPKYMLKILLHTKLLERTSNGELVLSSGPHPLEFYWVVPPSRVSEWTNRVAPKCIAKVPDGWRAELETKDSKAAKAFKKQNSDVFRH